MHNIILGFGALAINECQGQCHLACVLKSLIGYKCHQLTSVCKSVFSRRHGTMADCFRLNVFSTTATAQHNYGKDEQHSIFAAST